LCEHSSYQLLMLSSILIPNRPLASSSHFFSIVQALTPLHYASAKDHVNAVKVLLAAGAEATVTNVSPSSNMIC
jgi:hypothetical protein